MGRDTRKGKPAAILAAGRDPTQPAEKKLARQILATICKTIGNRYGLCPAATRFATRKSHAPAWRAAAAGLAAALPSCTIGIETCQGAHQGQHFWWPLARPRLRTITPPMHSSGRRAGPCGPKKGRRTDATAAGACAARPAWTGRRRPGPRRRPCRGGFHPAGIRERKSILPNAPATVFRLHPDPRRTALQSGAAASHGRLALAWMMHTVARARIRLRCVQSRSRRVNFKISLGGRNGSSTSQKRSFFKSETRQGD